MLDDFAELRLPLVYRRPEPARHPPRSAWFPHLSAANFLRTQMNSSAKSQICVAVAAEMQRFRQNNTSDIMFYRFCSLYHSAL